MRKTPWSRLKARPSSGAINVVVETPRGSRNKYKYDEKLGLFRLNRVLFAGASFPFDFGFIPGTRGGDGDPLDVLVLMDEPAFPGCLVRARAIGVLRATKDGKANHRVIAVSLDAKGWSAYRDLVDLPRSMVNEIERFFDSIQNDEHALLGFRNADAAERVIEGAVALEARRLGTKVRQKR
jgi:inorganic pyrophosphatase